MVDGEIKLKDIPENVHAELLSRLQHYMTCLFIVDVKGRSVTACGSGTLVKSKEEHGILTAAHVVHALQKKDQTALFLQSGAGPLLFDKGALEYVKCEDVNYDGAGPDIGYIRLPLATVGAIKAVKNFVNLDIHSEKLDEAELSTNEGVWCSTGFPEVWGDQKMDGEVIRSQVYGFVGVGTAQNLEKIDRHDYFLAGVDISDDGSLPDDYKGMSGGGVWQVTLVNKRDTGISVGDFYFRGVVFYQSDIEENERFIKCHGRKSIYEYVVPRLIHRRQCAIT